MSSATLPAVVFSNSAQLDELRPKCVRALNRMRRRLEKYANRPDANAAYIEDSNGELEVLHDLLRLTVDMDQSTRGNAFDPAMAIATLIDMAASEDATIDRYVVALMAIRDRVFIQMLASMESMIEAEANEQMAAVMLPAIHFFRRDLESKTL